MKLIHILTVAIGVQAVAVPRLVFKRGIGITVNGDGSSNVGGESGITTNADGSQSVGGASGINIAAPKAGSNTTAAGRTIIVVAGSEITRSNGTTGATGTGANKPKGTGNAEGLAALLGALNGAGTSKNGTSTAAQPTKAPAAAERKIRR